MWQEVKRKGKVLFRLDAERALIEVVRRGETEVIDLTKYGITPSPKPTITGAGTVI